MPTAGGAVGFASTTNITPPADIEDNVIRSQSFPLREGVRSIYMRHKRISGDGVGMARELTGKLAIGNGRGEVPHQVGI